MLAESPHGPRRLYPEGPSTTTFQVSDSTGDLGYGFWTSDLVLGPSGCRKSMRIWERKALVSTAPLEEAEDLCCHPFGHHAACLRLLRFP